MKKKILSILFVFAFLFARADEGMWLLYMLGDQTYNNMVKRGLKLSKEQLYSLNKSSLKDAIIIFGGGCTGEIVSKEGLIFTNHHCGYGAIAAASTVEKNYLRDGFWAKNKAEEIPAAGMSVQFLVRIEDATKEVEEALAGLNGAERASKLQAVSSGIASRVTQGSNFEARVMPFFKNNQYLVFVYERYRDIRLVGTPPESIGKFGGDTDNWEWPRHTGDFSVFRVYMSKDGKSSDYAADNIPLKPKYYLNVSTKGVKDGDFSMILGYPGGTDRYETSFGVKIKTEIENPSIVNLRDERLKLMMNEMKKSDAVRLQLASGYASVANYWKFFDGERKQLLKYDVYGQKKAEEDKFTKWVAGKPEYDGLFTRYEQIYKEWWPYTKHRMYLNEGILGSPLAAYASSLQALERTLTKKNVSAEEIKKVTESFNRSRSTFLSNENKPSDQNILAAMCKMFYADIDPAQHPVDFYRNLQTKYGDLNDEGTYKKYAADVFGKTMILDDAKWNSFIASPDSTTLQTDPAYQYAVSFVRNYVGRFQKKSIDFTSQKSDLDRIYMKGILEMNKGKAMYPDANFTMRLSSGNVKSYRPRDGVFYDYVTTMKGVIEKYVPGDYEFDLPKELIEAAKKKDYGIYKDARTNDLVVGFITTNDITGGNSGSPVLNANGELIGLAFDGNYEALSHKIAFDKDLNRTICVDIRYVLWCVDKLGGAKNIISELTLK
jgi:Peptidase S46